MVARRALAFVALVGLIVLAAVGIWRLASSRARDAAEVPVPLAMRSLAVVHAADSGDTLDWLARGLAEELGRALRHAPGLRLVTAPADASLHTRRLRELLNVGSVLELRLASRPRPSLRVELRDERDSAIFAAEYPVAMATLARTEDRIAADVVDTMRARAQLRAVSLPSVAGTRSETAHVWFLRALGDTGTTAKAGEGIGMDLESAVRVDTSYARAWSAWARWMADRGNRERAEAYAQRALTLDSAAADPHVTLADVAWWERHVPDAERHFLAAIRRDPTLARARNDYAIMLSQLGRHHEAVREARRAHELEPLITTFHDTYINALTSAGREAEARIESDERHRVHDILHPRPIVRRRASTHGTPKPRARPDARRR